MAQLPRQRVEIGDLRLRAAEERRRAVRAAELAMEFDARAADCPERLRAVYRRGAELHRLMQERQLAAARLHEAYADRLEQAGQAWPAPPPFMTAVAQALGACGATAALYGRGSGIPVLVAASAPTAKTVYSLEASAGEGPITMTAAEGRPVHAAGKELPARWPKYGPAANRLGVRSVTAVPMWLPAIRLGVLCCYGDKPTATDDVAAVDVIAAALAPILLRTAPEESLHDLMESPRSVWDNRIL